MKDLVLALSVSETMRRVRRFEGLRAEGQSLGGRWDVRLFNGHLRLLTYEMGEVCNSERRILLPEPKRG